MTRRPDPLRRRLLLALALAPAAARLPAAALDGGGRLALAAGVTNAAAGAAGEVAIAVLYPQLGEPFGTIFRQIVDGIETEAQSRVARIALADRGAPSDLDAELRDRGVGVVIALGRHGLRAAESLTDRLPVVGGAVLASPHDQNLADTVVSLTPDPGKLLERLRRLAPRVGRVFVVYSQQQNDWLMQLAEHAARRLGVELVARRAEDRRAALRAFQQITREARPGQDAVWLPQDAQTVDPEVVLPYVLQQAWDRSLALFSSTLAHVRRGALFALYPDNERMGRRLASSAVELYRSRPPVRAVHVEPLQDLLGAINVRTAGHLGLNVDEVLKDYALVFPVR